MKDRKAFRICDNRGFHIELPNGIVLSTQFGGGHYCENRDDPIETTDGKHSNNAEIGIWDDDGEWITREVVKVATGEVLHDDVMGHVGIVKWLKVLKACEKFNR